MSARPSASVRGAQGGRVAAANTPPAPADAAFAAVLCTADLPPFVVWSRRPLEAAAADALDDAAQTLGGRSGADLTGADLTGASGGVTWNGGASGGVRSYSKAYHGKASL